MGSMLCCSNIVIYTFICHLLSQIEINAQTTSTKKPPVARNTKIHLPNLNKNSLIPTSATIAKPIILADNIAPVPQPIQSPNTIPNNEKVQNDYNFEYSVHDPYTGDIKEHKESRTNDLVQGFYSLIEPDGRKRIVTYNANSVNGFNAIVTHEGVAKPEVISSGVFNSEGATISSTRTPIVSPQNILQAIPILLKSTPTYKNNFKNQQRFFGTVNRNDLQGAISHVAFQAPSYSYKYK